MTTEFDCGAHENKFRSKLLPLNSARSMRLHHEFSLTKILLRVSNYFAQSLKLLRILDESCDYKELMWSTSEGEIRVESQKHNKVQKSAKLQLILI